MNVSLASRRATTSNRTTLQSRLREQKKIYFQLLAENIGLKSYACSSMFGPNSRSGTRIWHKNTNNCHIIAQFWLTAGTASLMNITTHSSKINRFRPEKRTAFCPLPLSKYSRKDSDHKSGKNNQKLLVVGRCPLYKYVKI